MLTDTTLQHIRNNHNCYAAHGRRGLYLSAGADVCMALYATVTNRRNILIKQCCAIRNTRDAITCGP
ncbi:hypothetical protein TKWG_21135 [Advenella kashmirensis WT001]|uniref:Uncharacterized protein n=1 Tax=Advenella kashmirensis (strain DSM 17095 / LMG 22695 / WT001) TaxID=1036672 RepID=I3UFZ8_ADVKW|nr:hypothetical protein TKWG_21135 [Advenella kashmirensis WT001]